MFYHGSDGKINTSVLLCHLASIVGYWCERGRVGRHAWPQLAAWQETSSLAPRAPRVNSKAARAHGLSPTQVLSRPVYPNWHASGSGRSSTDSLGIQPRAACPGACAPSACFLAARSLDPLLPNLRECLLWRFIDPHFNAVAGPILKRKPRQGSIRLPLSPPCLCRPLAPSYASRIAEGATKISSPEKLPIKITPDRLWQCRLSLVGLP